MKEAVVLPAPLQPEIINRLGNYFLLQDTTFRLVWGLAPRVCAFQPTYVFMVLDELEKIYK